MFAGFTAICNGNKLALQSIIHTIPNEVLQHGINVNI
jgi:hypothetical protein